MVNLATFSKPEPYGQTELPDRSLLKDQKLVENAKIQKFKCDILNDFQTLCTVLKVCNSIPNMLGHPVLVCIYLQIAPDVPKKTLLRVKKGRERQREEPNQRKILFVAFF